MKSINWRERFNIPSVDGNEIIYFSGNSLGLQPKHSFNLVNNVLSDWKDKGVLAHHDGEHSWYSFHELLTKQMASIVGAKDKEVVIMNSLTVNIHLLLVSLYKPSYDKKAIMIEDGAFPSDLYAIKSHLRYHGLDDEKNLIRIPFSNKKNRYISTSIILEYIEKYENELALIFLGGVNYYNGQVFDMKTITDFAHSKDIIVGFDLAHAAGNINLKLHDWNVDFAAWCGYKYLNGGPGAPSGIFIHSKNLYMTENRFEGWWGNDKDKRFAMEDSFVPMQTAESWQISNPPILSMASLKGSLDIFFEIGFSNILEHSKVIQKRLWTKLFSINNIEIITPIDKYEHGCQISFRVDRDSKNVVNKLSDHGIVCDYREPDIIRIAPVPLYNTIQEIDIFINILKIIVDK